MRSGYRLGIRSGQSRRGFSPEFRLPKSSRGYDVRLSSVVQNGLEAVIGGIDQRSEGEYGEYHVKVLIGVTRKVPYFVWNDEETLVLL